jgi:hypothetical protein
MNNKVLVDCWYSDGDIHCWIGGSEYKTVGMSPHVQNHIRSLLVRGFNGKAIQVLIKYIKK